MAQEKIVQTAGRTQLGEFAPKFAELNDDVLFGEVWSRTDKLGLRDRSLVTVTSLISQGITDNSLVFHLQSAKKNGITRTEIAEIITHIGFYAGWPKAWAAFNLAKGVWAEDAAGEDAKAYSLFRFLVKPEMAYTLGGELKYGAPIQLEEKTVNLETGKYMKYTINAEGAESSYTERAIAVGDYYYADGSICPGTNDGDNIIKENCIGIIFATDNVSVSNGMDGSKKYTNGKVLALENYHTDEMIPTSNASTSSYYVNWGAHEVEEGNAIDKNSTDYNTFSGKLDGYAKTMDFAFSVEAVQNVLKFGKESNKAYAAPISSTGWYMPSIGELIEVFNAFGKSSDGGTYSLTSSDFKENNVNAGNKSATLLNLRNKLVKVDGELLQEFPDSPTSSTSKNYTDRWWSTTEVGDADFPDKQTWVIELKTNGQVKVLNRDKTGAQQASIRPILAF